MSSALAQPLPTPTRTSTTSWAVRLPGRDGGPLYVLAEHDQAAQLARAYRSFYSGGDVAVVRVTITEAGVHP